jgi:hypothetical protein
MSSNYFKFLLYFADNVRIHPHRFAPDPNHTYYFIRTQMRVEQENYIGFDTPNPLEIQQQPI